MQNVTDPLASGAASTAPAVHPNQDAVVGKITRDFGGELTPPEIRALVREARPGDARAAAFAALVADTTEGLGWEAAGSHLYDAMSGDDPLLAELALILLSTATQPRS